MTKDASAKVAYTARHQMGTKTLWGALLRSAAYVLAALPFCGFTVFMLHRFNSASMAEKIILGLVGFGCCPCISAAMIYDLFRRWTSYRFECDGLVEKRPFFRGTCIPWTDFQQVCIGRAPYGKGETRKVIVLVRKGGKRILSGAEVLTHSRKEGRIRLYYTPELLAGLRARCPLRVEVLHTERKP